MEIEKSTRETVPSDDHKDDPRSQEKNGCTDWEVTRSFQQRENIKNNQRVDEYNNWNEKYFRVNQ